MACESRVGGEQAAVKGDGFSNGVAEMEGAVDAVAGGSTHSMAASGITCESKEGGAEGNGVARRHNEAGDAVFDEFGHAADIGHDGGKPLGHGFENGLRQSFAINRRHDGDVAGADESGGIGAKAQEVDMREAVNLFLDVRIANFTKEQEVNLFSRRNALKGIQEDIDAFDGTYVADKSDRDGIRGDAKGIEIGAWGGGIPSGIVALPDDFQARIGNSEVSKIVANGVGNADNGIHPRIEIREARGGVPAKDVAHGAAIPDDIGRVVHAAGGEQGSGEGSVGESVDDVEGVVMQQGAVDVDGFAIKAVVKFVIHVRDTVGLAPLDGGAVRVIDGIQIDARPSDGAC